MKGEDDSKINSTQTMISIDSVKEVYVDVGHNFPPHILGKGEMMVPGEIANYIGKGIGDTALLSLGIGDLLGQDGMMQLLSIINNHDELTYDFEARMIRHVDGEEVSFDAGPIPAGVEPWLNMTIVDTFD